MSSRHSFSRAQIVVVILMIAFSLMSYFDRTIMSIAGPQIMKEFDLSATQMGSVYSAFILSYAIMMIPGGHVADRLGPRLTLLLMGLSAALFTGLTALGGKPGLGSVLGVVPALIAIRLGLGVGTAPLYPACAGMSANWISVHIKAGCRHSSSPARPWVARFRRFSSPGLSAFFNGASRSSSLPLPRQLWGCCGFGLSVTILPVFTR